MLLLVLLLLLVVLLLLLLWWWWWSVLQHLQHLQQTLLGSLISYFYFDAAE